MKYLPRFLQLLREDKAILSVFSSKDEYNFIVETVELFYKMQVHKFTNEEMTELYKRGMIYKELAKVSSRPFQSISRSLKSRITEEDKKTSRNNRKLWISMMNYINYVYETDKAGSWDYLQEKYPEKSLSHLKQMYRLSGGTYMVNRAKIKRESENAQIRMMTELNMSAEEIGNALGLAVSTVYYRLSVINGEQEEQETDTEFIDSESEALIQAELDEDEVDTDDSEEIEDEIDVEINE